MRHLRRQLIPPLIMKPSMLVQFWHTPNATQRNLATRPVSHVCGKRNHRKKSTMMEVLGTIVMTGILGNLGILYMDRTTGILETLGQPGDVVVMTKVQIAREVEMILNGTAGGLVAEQISGMTRKRKGTVTTIGQRIDGMVQKMIGMSTVEQVGEVVVLRIGRGETTTMATEGVTGEMTSTRTGG